MTEATGTVGSGEYEAPLLHLVPLIAIKGNGDNTPPREDWDPNTVFWWRLFIKDGLVAVDDRMKEDPARWHLEGLEPLYQNAKETEELVLEMEKLELGD